AALRIVFLIDQDQAGTTAAKQRRERLFEVGVDRREGFLETLPGRLIDFANGITGLRNRIEQVLSLRGQETVSRLELVELLDGHHVHGTKTLDFPSKGGNHRFGRHGWLTVVEAGFGRPALGLAEASPYV